MKMKEKTIIMLGVLGALGYFFYKTSFASASDYQMTYTPREFYPETAEILQLSASQPQQSARYKNAVNEFLNAPINTPESIKAGVDLINSGGQLPRLSQTISKSSKNSAIARLADGSIKQVSINQPVRDSQGRTNFDRIIAKNKILKSKK